MANQDTSLPTETDETPPKPVPIIPLLNSLALLATVGFFYYSKILYKRPIITENGERHRLVTARASPLPPPTPMFISFDPLTVNIKAIPEQPSAADGTVQQIHGKFHYATIGFSLEIRDRNQQDLVESLRPFILDKLVQTLGKKQFHELTTVQGRYILMSEMVDFTNHFVNIRSSNPSKEPLVTNAYFTQFIVQ